MTIQEVVPDLLSCRSGSAWRFWTMPGSGPGGASLTEICDVAYSLLLCGRDDLLAVEQCAEFGKHLEEASLHGRSADASRGAISAGVHTTAYALGVLRMLRLRGFGAAPTQLGEGWDTSLLLSRSGLPRWPGYWGHHLWRVSHWLGGVPAILRHLPELNAREYSPGILADTMAAIERSVFVEGRFRPYRSSLAQSAFRSLYRLRHDPALAEIGGAVHLLWAYHAGGTALPFTIYPGQAMNALHSAAPFIEETPYCLDFDIVQLIRISSQGTQIEPQTADRVSRMSEGIRAFLLSTPGLDYGLHRIPGALAALNECALLVGDARPLGGDVQPVDVIAEAFWL